MAIELRDLIPGEEAAVDAFLAKTSETTDHFVATSLGERVAYSAFNATVSEVVQIGGVWTPRALRGRGHGRSVVAGSLQYARDRGARMAVLFTAEDNLPAQRAYAGIGFEPIGNYGIVFFA